MDRHRIGVLLIVGVLPLDFAITMHVFAREAAESYVVSTASRDGRSVEVAGGMRVQPDGGLSKLSGAETVIVPGYANAAVTRLPPAVLRSLRAASLRGARMASICSGAFALAQANLLDGRTVTPLVAVRRARSPAPVGGGRAHCPVRRQRRRSDLRGRNRRS